MFEKLATPVGQTTRFGPVVLTHRAWGFTYQPWNVPALKVYSVLGIVDEGGFCPFPGTEDMQDITDIELIKQIAPGMNLDQLVGLHTKQSDINDKVAAEFETRRLESERLAKESRVNRDAQRIAEAREIVARADAPLDAAVIDGVKQP